VPAQVGSAALAEGSGHATGGASPARWALVFLTQAGPGPCPCGLGPARRSQRRLAGLADFKIASGAPRYRAVTCVVGRLPAACRTAIPHISRAAPRDRPSRGHLASGCLDRASCRSVGTFASWGAVRRAGDPIDPERSHAAPGSTATFAALDRGPARLLPSRLLAQPSPAPPYGDNAGKA